MREHDRRDLDNLFNVAAPTFPDAVQSIKGVMNVAEAMTSPLAVYWELTRHDHGERYLGSVRLFFAVFILLGMAVPLALFRLLPTTFGVFIALVIVMCAYRRFKIWWHDRQGRLWHSFNAGISPLAPIFRWTGGLVNRAKPHSRLARLIDFDENSLYRWWEPAIFMVISYFIMKIDPATGGILLLSAFAVMMRSQIAYNRMRDRIISVRDAQIEQAYMGEALAGSPPEKAAGLQLVHMPDELRHMLIKQRQAKGLDVAASVQAAMGQDTPPPPPMPQWPMREVS